MMKLYVTLTEIVLNLYFFYYKTTYKQQMCVLLCSGLKSIIYCLLCYSFSSSRDTENYSLRSRMELESRLQAYNNSLKGSVNTLRQRLARHLEKIVRKIIHPDRVQIEPALSNPAAICVDSDEVLVCADDEKRAITLEKDGVTIRGKSHKSVDYPAEEAAIESLAVCGRLV